MRPLTLDDLLPLDEYAGRRREFFDSHSRYLNRYRSVRIGPRLALLFENRQTLWFRVQELLRIARLSEPERVQQELNISNRLLPCRNQLQAALVIDLPDETKMIEDLAFWQRLTGHCIRLRLGDRSFPASLVTCRPEDRSIGAAHWVQFQLDPIGRDLLANLRQPACFEVSYESYQHASAHLTDDVRQSLLEDLQLSEKDD